MKDKDSIKAKYGFNSKGEPRKRPPVKSAFLNGHDVRKPFKYKNAMDLSIAINEYFESVLEYDEDGDVKIYNKKPATLTGLSLFLGYASTQQFKLQRNRNKAFKQIVDLALLRIEYGYEDGLCSKYSNGCKFVLSTSFGYVMDNDQKGKGDSKQIASIIL